MSILHAIVLGVVQGLAEYLPISSSGHLILVPWLFGWNDFAGDESLKKAFDVALHLGTLVGAVAYFRSDIARLARAAIVGPRGRDRRLALAYRSIGRAGRDWWRAAGRHHRGQHR